MSTATLAPASQALVNKVVDDFNNKKEWLISQLVDVYKKDAAITPEHFLLGLKGKQNIGTAYAAWYVHKSGISADKLNITFIANNYDSIKVQTSVTLMEAELKRVSNERDAVDNAIADKELTEGKTFGEAVAAADKALAKAMGTLAVATKPNTAAVMALQAKMVAFVELYQKVSELSTPSKEKQPAA